MKILKNVKQNTIIILIITLITLYFALKDDFSNIVDILLKADIKYILIALLFYFGYIFFKAYIIYYTANKKEDFTLKESIKHNIIIQFFNGITPFSTGGQPMEVYMLSKHNISITHSTNIIVENFMFYQIALVIYGLVAVLYNYFFGIFPNIPIMRKLVLAGFITNTFVAIVLFLVAFSPAFTRKCLKVIVDFFNKIHLIKNKEKFYAKWSDKLTEFHERTKNLKKQKKLFALGIFYNIISLTCFYIIPLFIAYSFHDFNNLTIMNTLTASAYVLITGSFIPIPGASGGIEYSFLTFFSSFIVHNKVNVALMLIWRFITYYLGMIVGAIMFNFDKGGKK